MKMKMLFNKIVTVFLSFGLLILGTGCEKLESLLGVSFGHKCSFTEKVTEEAYLKSAATNDSPKVYYYSCTCGKKGEKTFTYGKKLSEGHKCSFTQKVLEEKYLKAEATYEAPTTYYYSCLCGKAGEETFTEGKKLQNLANRNILILGDSYSTYEGYIPSGYKTWYPNSTKSDVDSVEETWWSLFVEKTQANLVLNNSWSGSMISYYEGSTTSSFIYRYKQLKQEGFFQSNNVDTVFVFGGTNDDWKNVELGEMQYSDWSETDLYKVRPAICYLTYLLKTDLPNAEIVLIINSDIDEQIQDCMETAAEYYGARSVRLENINKRSSHPTVAGMQAICDQIWNVLKFEP